MIFLFVTVGVHPIEEKKTDDGGFDAKDMSERESPGGTASQGRPGSPTVVYAGGYMGSFLSYSSAEGRQVTPTNLTHTVGDRIGLCARRTSTSGCSQAGLGCILFYFHPRSFVLDVLSYVQRYSCAVSSVVATDNSSIEGLAASTATFGQSPTCPYILARSIFCITKKNVLVLTLALRDFVFRVLFCVAKTGREHHDVCARLL